MSKAITTPKKIHNLVEYVKTIINLTNNDQQKFIFRGQSSSEYELSSGAYREISKIRKDGKGITPEDFRHYHQSLLEQAHKINSDEEQRMSTSPFELLAILQHGGAKTGLIDFSYNPLVALFFACQSGNEAKNKDGVVYFVEKSKFAVVNQDCTIENIFTHNDAWYNFILEPAALNVRILSQQGCFVIPNSGRIEEHILDKLIIPYKCKAAILKKLSSFGISEKELFKDFYGFCGWGAKSITESFFINELGILGW